MTALQAQLASFSTSFAEVANDLSRRGQTAQDAGIGRLNLLVLPKTRAPPPSGTGVTNKPYGTGYEILLQVCCQYLRQCHSCALTCLGNYALRDLSALRTDGLEMTSTESAAIVKLSTLFVIRSQGFNWESHHQQWYKTLGDNLEWFAKLGFTMIWLPPPTESVSPQGYLPVGR
jgi:hypothetical protein